VFGCCGFLSFSLVFCLLGGRLGTTLYIHIIRRWVKSMRHSSASREKKNKKKAEKNAILRSWDLWGRFVNRPVRLTASASPGLAPSGGGRTPRLSQPSLRLTYAGREAEKPNASVATQILSHRLHQPVHKEETCGVCVGFDAGLYR
jgi:hypothetical protein